MITVIAHYLARPEDVPVIREVLARHTVATRAEPGCLTFTAHQSLDDPNRFALYEAYTDEAAFQAHRVSDHFEANVEGVIAPLLVERVFARYEVIEP